MTMKNKSKVTKPSDLINLVVFGDQLSLKIKKSTPLIPSEGAIIQFTQATEVSITAGNSEDQDPERADVQDLQNMFEKFKITENIQENNKENKVNFVGFTEQKNRLLNLINLKKNSGVQ